MLDAGRDRAANGRGHHGAKDASTSLFEVRISFEPARQGLGGSRSRFLSGSAVSRRFRSGGVKARCLGVLEYFRLAASLAYLTLFPCCLCAFSIRVYVNDQSWSRLLKEVETAIGLGLGRNGAV